MNRQGFETYILSNGISIDAEKAKRLSKAGVKGVQVSIEGPEEVHEAVRGRGSFRASLKGVRHLLEAGMPVTLNTTLSDLNANRFMELVELAGAEGVQKLGFSRLVPSGRGRQLLDRMLSPEKVQELYGMISSVRTDGLRIVSGDPVYSMVGAVFDSTGDTPVGGCAAGLSGLTIMPDGTVTPCRRLPVPIGNVRKDSLREIWAASEVLNALRDRSRYKGKCGSCRRWDACRGCRAIAYAHSQACGEGDFLAEDPQCFI
ncbi:MAG: SPASM domain-containing protein [Candidatus Dadabacteria bacterium]|nr:MAG: SPASM domain-containing protein [Candidatus Dadabacteria bacterium]